MAELKEECGAKVVSQGSKGGAKGDPEESPFASILLRGVDELCQKVGIRESSMQVVVSGMASSSIGWVELPYARLPFSLDGSSAITTRFSLRRPEGGDLSVLLISGVQSDDDAMRGEETEILGFCALQEDSQFSPDSWLILPGTHSKHVCLDQGGIVTFRTFLTGELFELLCHQSILSQSVSSRSISLEGSKETFFCEGLKTAQSLGLSAGLFSVRTNTLLKQISVEQNTVFLSGLLIGSEVLGSPALQKDCPDAIFIDRRTQLSPMYEKAFSFLMPDHQICLLGQKGELPPVVSGHMLLLKAGTVI